jgi:hypothetical protein
MDESVSNILFAPTDCPTCHQQSYIGVWYHDGSIWWFIEGYCARPTCNPDLFGPRPQDLVDRHTPTPFELLIANWARCPYCHSENDQYTITRGKRLVASEYVHCHVVQVPSFEDPVTLRPPALASSS